MNHPPKFVFARLAHDIVSWPPEQQRYIDLAVLRDLVDGVYKFLEMPICGGSNEYRIIHDDPRLSGWWFDEGMLVDKVYATPTVPPPSPEISLGESTVPTSDTPGQAAPEPSQSQTEKDTTNA